MLQYSKSVPYMNATKACKAFKEQGKDYPKKLNAYTLHSLIVETSLASAIELDPIQTQNLNEFITVLKQESQFRNKPEYRQYLRNIKKKQMAQKQLANLRQKKTSIWSLIENFSRSLSIGQWKPDFLTKTLPKEKIDQEIEGQSLLQPKKFQTQRGSSIFRMNQNFKELKFETKPQDQPKQLQQIEDIKREVSRK